MSEQARIIIFGTTGMDRQRPTQALVAESGESWPALELVGFHPGKLPVLQLRLALVDVDVDDNANQPFRKTSGA